MYNIINKKKNGLELTREEIEYVVKGFTEGSIPDYQMSALLMAIVLNKMNERETFDFTMAMAKSGDLLSLDRIKKVTADKHSTGGVGDKTSLIVCPICAANDIAIPKMSGRGLGFTGGTIDKLESIPGFQTSLSEEEFIDNVNNTGMAIVCQSNDLAPADKKIYALRDVTATVDNISLIASSIMSKKLASGAKIIVLDVKYGSGAFMKNVEDACELAKMMIAIGKYENRKMYAMISNMDQPLGNYIGNRLEVYEAVKVLMNEGPADLYEASVDLSALILLGAGKAASLEEGRKIAAETIKSGKALAKFREFVKAQHGNDSFVDDPEAFIGRTYEVEVPSRQSGYVVSMDTEAVGLASMYLGGGRRNKDDVIDPDVGIYVCAKPGDYVEMGDPLVKFYCKKNYDIGKAENLIQGAYSISDIAQTATNGKQVYAYLDENGYMEA